MNVVVKYWVSGVVASTVSAVVGTSAEVSGAAVLPGAEAGVEGFGIARDVGIESPPLSPVVSWLELYGGRIIPLAP